MTTEMSFTAATKKELCIELLKKTEERKERFFAMHKKKEEKITPESPSFATCISLQSAITKPCEDVLKEFTACKEILRNNSFTILKEVKITSFVKVEFEDGRKKNYFIYPAMASYKPSAETTVITPFSPLGKALMGKCIGNEFSFFVTGKEKNGIIKNIR